jgi:glycosyltransferase involved in cell wall biosynthesis
VVLTRRVDRRWPPRSREHQLDVRRLGTGPAGGAAFAARGAAWIAAARPDVVHAHGLLSATAMALAGAAPSGIPVVAKVLSSGPHGDVARLRTKPGGERRLTWALRRAAALICVSAEVEAELRALGVPPERLARIPNGVDVRRLRPPDGGPAAAAARRTALGLPADGPLLVSCGRLDARKRLDLLVRALGSTPGTLVLVGDGPERARLGATARAAGVGARVVVRATVDDVTPYLWAADAYVTASAQDGLSNAVLEAMACGLPVVAAGAGGMAELVDAATGVAVPDPTPAALGAAIAGLLGHPERAAGLGAAGRDRVVAGYALDATARRLAALYRRVARA